MSRPWNEMWDLFHSALELDPPSREAWLRERCPDESVRGKVANLLAAHEKADGFLESGSGWGLPASGATRATASPAPSFDRYQLGDKIGEGGFSEVFLARQLEPVQREVAIKVLRASLNDARRSERILERFEAERQTLASLHHPGIATIFDAGISPDGRPYFVMEHIAGVPITRYWADKRLPLRRRLDLFIETCSAVQHAHHKGVIHRDLKPSNILITEIDGIPRVKVIDFGIASMVDDAAPESPSRWHAGTPGYMSPEQAGAGGTDTRTDVFSLGVILYELLTGAAPYKTPDGLSQTLERTRAQTATDSPPPSRQLHGAAARRLRGELDWITLKALSRDRADRYGSAADFAADIRLHLDRRPTLAGPATARYRASRFIARHRFGTAVAFAAVLVLISGIVLLAAKARTEARLRAEAVSAKDLALRDARMSEQTALFLRQEIIAGVANRPTAAAAMLELLDAAEAKVGERFKTDPLAEAAVRRTLSDVYQTVKRHDKAIANAQRAVHLLSTHLGEDRHTYQAINNLGIAYRQAGRAADAVPLYERSRIYWRRVNGPDARETIAQDINYGGVLNDVGRYRDAEPPLRDAYATALRAYGPEDPLTGLAAFFLASTLLGLEQWQESEALLRATYEQQRRLGEDHARTVGTRARLASVLNDSGRPAEAEPLFRSVIESNIRRFSPDHLDTIAAQASLARCLVSLKRFNEAEPLYTQALARFTTELGKDHPRTLGLLNAIGDLYRASGRNAEAEVYFRAAADAAVAQFAADNAWRGRYLFDHGICLLDLDRPEEAEGRLAEAATILETAFGPGHRRSREANAVLTRVSERLQRAR